MERTIVHLMRHGEVHNPAGVLYGRIPGFGLSALGHQMAERVAEHLVAEGHDIRAVLASPLQRAQETATPVARAFGLELGTDERVIEAENHFEGVSVTPAELMRPAHWRAYLNPLRPSWGEPYRSQVARMRQAIIDARGLAEGGEAVLVSHQLPIWSTRRHLQGRPLWHDPRRRECSLASLTSLTFLGQRLIGVRYSEPAGELLVGAKDTVPGTSPALIPAAPGTVEATEQARVSEHDAAGGAGAPPRSDSPEASE
ncbi:histidine phosphatase family protein [Bogoriella caseilytica]|uniref:Broad specificity phosphatase PhoE n=1 Tax=Bogoriella caseilytica TaxID=56055 RepID=A0A3N2BAR7_9MICO|nr:broad specificity phosphatase PhoE [Bogoriella caseilytica]